MTSSLRDRWLRPRLWLLLIAGSMLLTVPACGGDASPSSSKQAAKAQEESEGGGDCDPNYAGACLKPDSSDYDCAGGSGDGPDYTGPVQSIGSDPYDLDRDGDGSACEA